MARNEMPWLSRSLGCTTKWSFLVLKSVDSGTNPTLPIWHLTIQVAGGETDHKGVLKKWENTTGTGQPKTTAENAIARVYIQTQRARVKSSDRRYSETTALCLGSCTPVSRDSWSSRGTVFRQSPESPFPPFSEFLLFSL